MRKLQYVRSNFNLGYSYRNRQKVKILFAYNCTYQQHNNRLNFESEVLSLNLIGEEIVKILRDLSLCCEVKAKIKQFYFRPGQAYRVPGS